MGVGSSLPQNHRDYEPPPLPSPFGPGGHFQGFSRASGLTLNSTASLNNQSQEQRPRDSSIDWSQRPPHETLLTYATQMTGWQSDYPSTSPSVHQEAMELTRTVSHLAAANQQLASAHSSVLSQLEGLYRELSKEKETNAALQSSLRRSEEKDLKKRLEAVEEALSTPKEDWKPVKRKDEGDYARKEYQKAVERIKVLEAELRASDTRWRGEGELRNEVVRLRADQVEAQEVNKKLRRELERIRRDHEVSRNRCRQIEDSVPEKPTARTKLADDKRVIANGETQTEDVPNKKDYGEALEESLKEIQRLNDIISGLKDRSTKNSDAETSTEDEQGPQAGLEDFKKDLGLKREARQRAIAAVSSEMDRLRRELDAEKEAHSETSRVLDLLKTQAELVPQKSETFSVGTITHSPEDWKPQTELPDANALQKDAQRLTDVLKVSDELRGCIRLQLEKLDDLRYHLECEPESNQLKIETLKEIGRSHRESFETRERQMNRLKSILSQIVARLGDETFRIDIAEDLRSEHDRQVDDIRRLKSLYDERMRILIEVKDSASKELVDSKQKLKILTKDKESVDEELKKAEEKVDLQDSEISNLESQLGLTKADCRDLQNQMSLINSLFSQMLLSASSAEMDLDRLTQLLQENHELISEMAREEGTEAAALPKLLLDLVEQVEGREKSRSSETTSDKKDDENQEESIANNLPKVWKVLTELLSCHATGTSAASTTSNNLLTPDPNSCYKSVDTPTGPRLVISVSKTYIRLKELILEKKHLEKEMGRMKQLNTHLESKLGEQEKRLSTVASELSKTWNIVGRMQAQHQQLHTHEKILRYELQQKRKMLQELKQELEYCREKWESARQKNTNTEIEWKNLRREFAARKALAHDSFNNSAESGFSDDRCDDSDDDEDKRPGDERLRSGPRRRTRKESPRAPTPDTESDHDVSAPKSESSSTPDDHRTPTPETSTTPGEESPSKTSPETQTSMNPLDQALANVIQNLIQIEPLQAQTPPNESPEPKFSEAQAKGKTETVNQHTPPNISNPIDKSHVEDTTTACESTQETIPGALSDKISVFSIGPFPNSSGKSVQFSEPLVVGPSSCLEAPIFGAVDAEGTSGADAGCEEVGNVGINIESEEVGNVGISTTNRKLSNVETDAESSEVGNVGNNESVIREVGNVGINSSSREVGNVGTDCAVIGEVCTAETDTATQEVGNAEISATTQEVDNAEISINEVKQTETVKNREKIDVLENNEPSTSTSETVPPAPALRPTRTPEEVLAARDARLKRLEEQADWLMKKMSATSRRGSALSSRLEELHEAYGEAPAPPPMPDVLPTVRIPTNSRVDEENDTATETDNSSSNKSQEPQTR